MQLDPVKRRNLFTRDVVLQHLAHMGELLPPDPAHICSRDTCFPRNYLQLHIQRSSELEEDLFVCRKTRVHICNNALCAGRLAGPGKSEYVCPISRKTKGQERLEIEIEERAAPSAADRMSGKDCAMTRALEISEDALQEGAMLDAYYSRYSTRRLIQPSQSQEKKQPLPPAQALSRSKLSALIKTKARKDTAETIAPGVVTTHGLLKVFAGTKPVEISSGIPVFLHLPECGDYIQKHLFRKTRDGNVVPTTTLLLSAGKLRISACMEKYLEWIEQTRKTNNLLRKKDDLSAWRVETADFNKKTIPILKRIEQIFDFYFPSLGRWRANIPILRSQQCQKYAEMLNTLRTCRAKRIFPNLYEIALALDLGEVWRSESLVDFPTHTMYLRYFRIVYTMLQYCLATYRAISRRTSEAAFKSVTVDKLLLGILDILQSGYRSSDGTTIVPKDFYLNRKGIAPEKNRLTMLSRDSRKIQSHGVVVVSRCLEFGLLTMSPAQLWNEVSGNSYRVYVERENGKLTRE